MAPPSAPRDVNLTVISTTELGVYWHKPLFSGSTSDDTVVKYLVEWDKTSAFAMSAATVGGPTYFEATSYSHVTTETKYQIIGLEQGQEYYVRVSAFGASPSQDRPLKAEQYDTMVQAAGVDASVKASVKAVWDAAVDAGIALTNTSSSKGFGFTGYSVSKVSNPRFAIPAPQVPHLPTNVTFQLSTTG